jgi:hypothetical protein
VRNVAACVVSGYRNHVGIFAEPRGIKLLAKSIGTDCELSCEWKRPRGSADSPALPVVGIIRSWADLENIAVAKKSARLGRRSLRRRRQRFDQGEFYAFADGVDAFGADVDGVA